MTRNARVLDYLQNNKKGLTVKECQQVLGTTELRKIVCDLEDKGFKFARVWEYGENRFGELVRYKRYTYLGKNKEA